MSRFITSFSVYEKNLGCGRASDIRNVEFPTLWPFANVADFTLFESRLNIRPSFRPLRWVSPPFRWNILHGWIGFACFAPQFCRSRSSFLLLSRLWTCRTFLIKVLILCWMRHCMFGLFACLVWHGSSPFFQAFHSCSHFLAKSALMRWTSSVSSLAKSTSSFVTASSTTLRVWIEHVSFRGDDPWHLDVVFFHQ